MEQRNQSGTKSNIKNSPLVLFYNQRFSMLTSSHGYRHLCSRRRTQPRCRSILSTEVAMKPTGKGEIDAYPTNWRWEKDTLWAEATVLLYNFDVDGSDLKKEHLDFLHDQVLFFLDDG